MIRTATGLILVVIILLACLQRVDGENFGGGYIELMMPGGEL